MGEGRFRSLADSLGLSDRVLCGLECIKGNLPALLAKVDYDAVRRLLSVQRTQSLEYLKQALSTSKVGKVLSDYDISRIRFDKKINDSKIQISSMKSQIDSAQNQISSMQSHLGSAQSLIDSMQSQIDDHKECANMLQDCLLSTEKSKYYQIGRAVTFIPRKLRGAIRCLREHGVKYSIIHTCEKIAGVFRR